MITSFKHKGLKAFFDTGSTAGIQPAHAPRLSRMPVTTKGFDRLSPNGGGNWRLTFRFEGEDAVLVDYQDYH